MINQNSAMTAATLANAADLAANIAQGVMGNEVATTFNGSELTRATIYNLAQVTFQSKVASKLGAK